MNWANTIGYAWPTSDGLEQTIILGHESQRISARAFEEEVKQMQAELEARIRQNNER